MTHRDTPPDELRDITVAGLIRRLQGLVEMDPRIAGYAVLMEDIDTGRLTPWRGTTCLRHDDLELELESPS